MVALIREPPRNEGPARRISLRSSHDEVDVSAIARASGGGGHRQAAGFSSERSIDEIIDFIRREFALATQGDGAAARSLKPGRGRAGRQAGGAVVVCDRGGAATADARADRSCRDARSVCDRSAGAVVGSCDQARSLLRRPGQALRDRRRSDVDDVDRRSRGRAARAPSGTGAACARGSARGPSRRGRAADSRRVGGQDRRRARVQARAPGCRCRDAGAAVARAFARGGRVHRRDGAPRAPRQLGHLRPVDRTGARRPLHDAAPDRRRAVRRRRVASRRSGGAPAGCRRTGASPGGAMERVPETVRAGVLALDEANGGAAA